jgi:hypothetical protein
MDDKELAKEMEMLVAERKRHQDGQPAIMIG